MIKSRRARLLVSVVAVVSYLLISRYTNVLFNMKDLPIEDRLLVGLSDVCVYIWGYMLGLSHNE